MRAKFNEINFPTKRTLSEKVIFWLLVFAGLYLSAHIIAWAF